VSIGFSPSIGEPVMAEILTALCERFPQNRFVTRTIVGDARLAASLDSGEIDCAFVVDSSFVPERVSWHNILVTPRRILSAAPGGKDGPTDASTDWILLQEDSEDGSPIRNFLSHRARARSHRETVVPSWQTQIALLQATGGTCAILDFNVTLVPRDDRMRVIAPPSSFPKSATLQFWTQARTSGSQSLIEIRDIATTILQDPGKAIHARAFPMIAHREYAAA
jgi:DNA-binding transcriptional LysR family regulator